MTPQRVSSGKTEQRQERMSTARADRIRRILGQLTDAITDLDALQVGEYAAAGRLLAIKWRIRTALAGPLEDLRQIAEVEEGTDPQQQQPDQLA